ncbi:protein FdrA [Leekyejoonella antrihumi]|uniref:Protein FdrA n=2 Tax=Leekyejoonella antrihumi TaxID=1660198 RepID=A0A563E8B9_9MICO|nr:protein FdrA [Leekyejoonella antrihumi]
MRAMREADGVQWATAVAATPANLAALRDEGITDERLSTATANDFCLAVRADESNAADHALELGQEAVFTATPKETATTRHPRTVRATLAAEPETNVAVVSVPGDYAALAAYQALSAGLHVLLFSDNVPLRDELALKTYARSRGLLVMGPGAGTAMLAGTGLGFANAVSHGRVGVVAAAGTGAQEAMTLLDRWGVGVSQVIGVGGRDLSSDIDGRMARSGVEYLRDDPDTDAILLVSKPPAKNVAQQVIESAGTTPLVAALIGLDESGFAVPDTVTLARTLESGVAATLRVLGHSPPDTTRLGGPALLDARNRLAPGRRTVRGLFSGGTLCYESLVILGAILGSVYSNTPINRAWCLPAPAASHQCLDLGEEEYTKGRPHPMIDPEARIDVLREHAADDSVAAIILDVVLGYGSNPDPAGALAPVCAEIMANGGPQIVAYVLGTDSDPQRWSAQRDTLMSVGAIVTETAARASFAAAALATGDLSLMETPL